MEAKLNIAEILKDKPKGTKLYSPLFGDVYLSNVECDVIRVEHHEGIAIFFSNGRYYNYPESEPLLFPSKEMRDWEKFAWKKGDVLIGDAGYKVLFDKWENDDYTRFFGSVKVHSYDTEDYALASKEEALEFIKSIEKIHGGKLNRETLEIENTHPEFKDGDILCVIDNSNDYHYILIYKGQDDKHIYRYVTMFEDNSLHIRKDAHLTKPEDYSMRYATDSEKQQLFDALAKEIKAWGAEKKQIVDINEQYEFKPFDRVLVRDEDDCVWCANIFSHINSHEEYVTIGCERGYTYCLPYEGNEHLLGTTKDVEG